MRLKVQFNFETKAVWRRRGKTHIFKRLQSLKNHRMESLQTDLEAVLLGNSIRDFPYHDPQFPFRFGNGGTLPVIRRGDKDYYCLFYRETHPVGWNIANGGADSLAELLDPAANIERELREELLIFEPKSGRRYVFAWDEGQPADHPDFAIGRKVWTEVFRRRHFSDLQETPLPLKWLRAPDSAIIQFENHKPLSVDNVILNVNAQDFGIEIDRIAKLTIGADAVLCDGEVVRGQLLNRVIGLFEVQRFNGNLAANRTNFRPDIVFHTGRDRTTEGFDDVLRDYLDDINRRAVFAGDSRRDFLTAKFRFDLCPVTRNVIKRYLLLDDQSEAPRGREQDFGAFVSFASEDRCLAAKVFAFLRNAGHRPFFSDETVYRSNFASAVDDAVEAADAMVVVSSQIEHLLKPWVQYEWQSFHNHILSGRKSWHAPLLTLGTNFNPQALPKPLCFRQVLLYNPVRPQPALQQLGMILRHSPTRTHV